MIPELETDNPTDPDSIEYTELHMRPEKNNDKDFLIKRLFYEQVKERYDVKYVVDDRLQVCRMWHEIGLCLLKVGDPNLDF